jgi:hypothetical protein
MIKIIKLTVILAVFSLLNSCKSQPIEFENFPYTTTYFPSQFPLRTLVFGDYKYENDNDCSFLISAAHGGGYENKKDVTVGFEIVPSLVDNLYTGNTKLRAMPSNWYTLSSPNQIIIPKGSRQGGVTVTLNDAFFNDPGSIGTNWVIPVRMTSTTADSILSGRSPLQNPDPRLAGDWELAPKNYTIFAVRYVNEWHGRYLLRGTAVSKEADGTVAETIHYRARYLELNQVVSMTTSGRRQVRYSAAVRQTPSPGNFAILLDYSPSDNVTATLTSAPNSTFPVEGTAKMVKNAESWGDIARDVIYLDYRVMAGNRIYEAKDTLVFRDKNVQYQEYASIAVRP